MTVDKLSGIAGSSYECHFPLVNTGDRKLSSKGYALNEFQKETRERVDGLIKFVVLIAFVQFHSSLFLYFVATGFTQDGRAATIMPYTWWLLVGTIVFGVLALYTFALRDYLLGERLRNNLVDHSANDRDLGPGYHDKIIQIFSHLGMLCFVLGTLSFAYSLSLSMRAP